MRTSAAIDDGEDVSADDLVGPAVKGDVEDLDVDAWPDETDDGDTPGPDRAPKRKSKGAGK